MQGRPDSKIVLVSQHAIKKTWYQTLAQYAYWVFPPTLLLGLAKKLASWLFSARLTKWILPIYQQTHLKAIATDARNRFLNGAKEDGLQFERVTLQTADGALLDTVELYHHDDEFGINRPHIIYFGDEHSIFEQHLAAMAEDCRALNANVTGFNYRGVAYSEGKLTGKQQLLNDGIAQVQRLLDKGVSPSNIFLKGRSLGAATATLIAQYFHAQQQPISIFNGCSFSSMTNFMVGQIRTQGHSGHIETRKQKLLGWLAKPFVHLKLYLTDWDMNPLAAYQALPKQNKEYMLVRSGFSERTPVRRDDSHTTHYASLHLGLKPERQAQKINLQVARKRIMAAQKHGYLFQDQEHDSLQALQGTKIRARVRKMITKEAASNGHNVQDQDLIDRYQGLSGIHFFHTFVRNSYRAGQPDNFANVQTQTKQKERCKLKPGYGT